MKFDGLFQAIFASSLILSGLTVNAVEGHVRLLNGDRVSGTYSHQEGGVSCIDVTWNPEPIPIPSKYIGEIFRSVSEPDIELPARIHLHNDDVLRVEMLELQGDMLRMRTIWADQILFPVDRIRMMDFPDANSRLVYQGPGSLKDWRITPSENAPLLNLDMVKEVPDGILVLGQALLEKSLPPVQGPFTMEWTLGSLSEGSAYLFELSGIAVDPQGGALASSFVISSNTIHHRMLNRDNRSVDQWVVSLREFPIQGTGPVTFKLFIDPQTRMMSFWVKDVRIHQWEVPAVGGKATDASMKPRFSMKMAHGSGATRLTSFRVTKQDAAFHGELRGKKSEPVRDHARLMLGNGDVLEGKLKQVDARSIRLEYGTQGAELDLDLGRIRKILLPTTHLRMPLRHRRDVVLSTNDGSDRFTVRLLDVDAERIYFELDGLEGRQSILKSQVEQVIFNPHADFRKDTVPYREITPVHLIQ